ncbi:hypothetical protein CRG98_012033 [Punica granatum]|uniref:Integrase zinc-binding domain-containing protein n=1 Tax=Punica granatum TaxID=22663 RepID=A0A2I0KG29_PUNGR|nr:hypothetical protein CRG98_012033 [Punica granatum]
MALLKEFVDVFLAELPEGLPPIRGIEYQIDLVPGSALPNRPAYRCNPNEAKGLQRQVNELLEKGPLRSMPSILGESSKLQDVRNCIPSRSVRELLMREAHAEGFAGHFGEKRTLEIVKEHFYWPQMIRDVHRIIERCITCKKAKTNSKVCLDGNKRAEQIKALLEQVKKLIGNKNTAYARGVNEGRKQVHFNRGDLVWIHLRKERFPKSRWVSSLYIDEDHRHDNEADANELGSRTHEEGVKAHDLGALHVLGGPITRAKAKQIQQAMESLLMGFLSQEESNSIGSPKTFG